MPFEPVRMPPIEFPIQPAVFVAIIIAALMASLGYRLLIPGRRGPTRSRRRTRNRFRGW